MASYVSFGLNAVKMKVGRGDVKSEEARIAAARKAIGPDVLLMLDANNAWSDVPTALRYMARFAPYDPYWIEEPFSPDQIENHAKLAAAISTPVATGEIEAGRWRFKELLDKKQRPFCKLTPPSVVASPNFAALPRWPIATNHVPTLVPRLARPSGGSLAQRSVRRIFSRWQGIQLLRNHRPAVGAA